MSCYTAHPSIHCIVYRRLTYTKNPVSGKFIETVKEESVTAPWHKHLDDVIAGLSYNSLFDMYKIHSTEKDHWEFLQVIADTADLD